MPLEPPLEAWENVLCEEEGGVNECGTYAFGIISVCPLVAPGAVITFTVTVNETLA